MMPIGTAYNYAKSLQLQQKWNLKQRGISTDTKSSAAQISSAQQKALTLSTITSKLKSGQRLSNEELEYLRVHSPELHEKAVKLVKERDEYRRLLNKCRSQEAVQKTNNTKLHELADAAKVAADSHSVSEMEFVEMRIAGIQNEHAAFLNTSGYRRLPHKSEETEKESQEERKHLQTKA